MVRMTGLDLIKVRLDPALAGGAPPRRIGMGSRPVFFDKQKRGQKPSFLFGADDRTRTCTLARWNLRVMSPQGIMRVELLHIIEP